MHASDIRFGTDGWRAILGEGFTSDRFRVAIAAVAASPAFVAARRDARPVIVAWDTRLCADRFAWLAAADLQQAGFRVLLGNEPAATPGIGAAIVRRNAAAGLMITASHNPPEYLGLKIKGPWGGSATPDWIAAIETQLEAVPIEASLQALPTEPPPGVERIDVNAEHLARLAGFLNPTPGAAVVVHDAMHGSGRGLVGQALQNAGGCVIGVRDDLNPGFGGHGPEPIESRLGPMAEAVRTHGADFGMATDGDGDRIAACDHNGRFIYPHEIFALNLLWLTEVRGLRGRVVRSVSTGELVARVAAHYGCELTTVPVGFKHTVEEMLAGGVLIGGEESGGIAVAAHLPERDGILNGLLLRELLLARAMPLRAILDELRQRFGASEFRRWDLHIPETAKDAILEGLRESPPTALGPAKVERVDRLDGTKFFCNDAWLLVRASGTEPILRVYAEAPDVPTLEAMYTGFEAWTDSRD